MRLFRIILVLFLILPFMACGKNSVVKQLNLNRVKGIRGALAPVIKGKQVTFRIKAEDASLVTLAGNFNGWNAEVTPMKKSKDGVWHLTLPLKKGKTYLYKFVIDGFWVADPDNPDVESDGFGGVNSKIKIPRGEK